MVIGSKPPWSEKIFLKKKSRRISEFYFLIRKVTVNLNFWREKILGKVLAGNFFSQKKFFRPRGGFDPMTILQNLTTFQKIKCTENNNFFMPTFLDNFGTTMDI